MPVFFLECSYKNDKPVADIVFLMDSSGSIIFPDPTSKGSPENYDYLRGFIANLVNRLDISEDGNHVGLVRFSNTATSIFPLNFYYSPGKMAGVVNNIPFVGGTTNTSGALREALANQFTVENGDRPDAPNIAVLITDGNPNVDEPRTESDAEALRNGGVYLLAIGVTDAVDKSMLSGLTSCPQEEEEAVHFRDTFEMLNSDLETVIVEEINEVVRKQCGDILSGIFYLIYCTKLHRNLSEYCATDVN